MRAEKRARVQELETMIQEIEAEQVGTEEQVETESIKRWIYYL